MHVMQCFYSHFALLSLENSTIDIFVLWLVKTIEINPDRRMTMYYKNQRKLYGWQQLTITIHWFFQQNDMCYLIIILNLPLEPICNHHILASTLAWWSVWIPNTLLGLYSLHPYKRQRECGFCTRIVWLYQVLDQLQTKIRLNRS